MSAQLLAFKTPAAVGHEPTDANTAAGLFGEYMLMELVLEVARSSNDPHGRLAELFDRVSLRAQRGCVATDKNSVLMQFRRHAEHFFVMAGKNV